MAVLQKADRRVALITGAGRSGGIGAHIAKKLAEGGLALVLVDLPAVVERSLVDGPIGELITEYGEASVLAIGADITSEEAVRDLTERAVARFGRIDILVNNAAFPQGADRNELDQVPLSAWDDVFRVNSTAPFLLCRDIVSVMKRSGWGRVVNIASMAGVVRAPRLAAYSASKAALLGLTRSLAMDVARFGITVNAVCPGVVATQRTGADANGILTTALQTAAQNIPVGRVANAADVANAVLFFANERSDYITGQYLAVDGGGPINDELPAPVVTS